MTTSSSMVQPSFETNTSNGFPAKVWIGPLVRVNRGQRTLEVEVTTQPLHTDPSECSFYSSSHHRNSKVVLVVHRAPISRPKTGI